MPVIRSQQGTGPGAMECRGVTNICGGPLWFCHWLPNDMWLTRCRQQTLKYKGMLLWSEDLVRCSESSCYAQVGKIYGVAAQFVFFPSDPDSPHVTELPPALCPGWPLCISKAKTNFPGKLQEMPLKLEGEPKTSQSTQGDTHTPMATVTYKERIQLCCLLFVLENRKPCPPVHIDWDQTFPRIVYSTTPLLKISLILSLILYFARSPNIPIDIYFPKCLVVTDSSCVLTFPFTL